MSKYSAPDSSNSFESISLGKISEDVKRHEIGKILECGLTEQDVRLFKLLKENYILTARELMETCQEYDKYQLEQNTMPANMTQDEDVGQKLVKLIQQLRFDKLSIGSLMRVVRSQKYENISDNLCELKQIQMRVPKLSKYVD